MPLRLYTYVGRFLLCRFRSVQYIVHYFPGFLHQGCTSKENKSEANWWALRQLTYRCSDIIWNLSLAVGLLFFPGWHTVYVARRRFHSFTLCPSSLFFTISFPPTFKGKALGTRLCFSENGFFSAEMKSIRLLIDQVHQMRLSHSSGGRRKEREILWKPPKSLTLFTESWWLLYVACFH